MITLDRALDRLLHSRTYRRAFLEARFELLDLAPDDVDALSSIDTEQLERTAERVARDLCARKHRGSGGLRELYPRTLAAWKRAHPEDEDLSELTFLFLESDEADRYRELPFAGIGLSLEEAFYEFCEGRGIGDAAEREQEFLTAMMKALVVSPSAEMTLPVCVQRAPHGFYAVSSRGAPVLHAAVRGRFVRGTLTPFLAELLTSGDQREEIASRHGVDAAALEASLDRLRGLGLA